MDIDFKRRGSIEEYSAFFAMIIFGVLDDKDIDVLIVVFVFIKNVIELYDNRVAMLVLSVSEVKLEFSWNSFRM